MSIALRSVSETHANTDASGNIVVTKPTGTVSGDVMLAGVVFAGNQSLTAAPSGWTLLFTTASPTPAIKTGVYWKVAGGSEPASYTWTVGLAATLCQSSCILTYTGVDTGSPINASGGQGNANGTAATPTITTTVANCMLVGFFGQNANGTPTWTNPSGFTKESEGQNAAAAGAACALLTEDKVQSAAGGVTATATSSRSEETTGALVALTPLNTAPTVAFGASSLADGAFPNTATPSLTVYVTDPDAAQTLTVTYDVATDSGFASIIYTGTTTAASPQTAGAVSKTTSALTKGVLLYWRAKVSDGTATSSYTSSRTFTIYDDPTVTIGASTPATTVSTGGPNITVTYVYAQAQSLAQASRRIRVQNAAGSTTYYDSGVVMAATVTLTIDAVAAGIPTDTTGTALKVVVDVVAATSGAAGTSNKAFDIQWGVVTLTITTPSNNSVIATTALTPAWSFASTRSKTQASYRFRLLQAGTGAVLYDSGFVTSAVASALLGYTLVDTGNYVLEVTAKNSEGVLSS